MKVDENKIFQSLELWCKKLRVSPSWDVRLEFVDDLIGEKQPILKLTAMTEKRFCF